jgi:hypothetical protein
LVQALSTNYRGARGRTRATTDGGGDDKQNHWEVAQGAKTVVGHHVMAPLADARWVANARLVTADPIGAGPRSLSEDRQQNEVRRCVHSERWLWS